MDITTRLRDTGNLTATETLTAVLLTPMSNPLYLHFECPSKGAASDAVVISIVFRNSSGVTLGTITAPSFAPLTVWHKAIPFFAGYDTVYDMVVTLTLTDADTASVLNLGVANVWISPSPIS